MTAETDLHIYQGGVALQQAFIFVFVAASIKFHRTFARESPTEKKAQALFLLYTVYAVLALITVCFSLSARLLLELWDAADKQPSSEFCFALPNTRKASQARFQTMRYTSIVWTHCRCSLPLSFSILYTRERSWLVKRAIFLAGKIGRTWHFPVTQDTA